MTLLHFALIALAVTVMGFSAWLGDAIAAIGEAREDLGT